jgi:hypothetical protein
MSNPSFLNLNITNDQLLLINILNTFYNDNLRQINSLTNSNNEIRTIITNLLNNRSQQNNRFRNRNNNTNNRENSTPNTNINNSSHEQRVPYTYLYSWVDTSDISLLEARRQRPRQSNLNRVFQRFLDPVEVFPTQAQIETATRRVRYCDIVSPINRSCPISLENFNDTDTVSIIRYCGHIFHTEHLTTWFRTNCRCPICRYDIRDYNSPASSNFFTNNETNVAGTPNMDNSNEESNTNNTNNTSNPSNTNNTNNTSNTSNTNNTNNTSNTNNTNNTSNQYINSFLNNLVNDVNFQDIENLGNIFLDGSGNYANDESTQTVLFTLLNTISNIAQR